MTRLWLDPMGNASCLDCGTELPKFSVQCGPCVRANQDPYRWPEININTWEEQ